MPSTYCYRGEGLNKHIHKSYRPALMGIYKPRTLTWYVLSKLSYINLVINDVFPTETERGRKKKKQLGWILFNRLRLDKE